MTELLDDPAIHRLAPAVREPSGLAQAGRAQVIRLGVGPRGRAHPPQDLDQRAARRSLQEQIARLERQLAEAFVAAYPTGGLACPHQRHGQPRLLDLGELELVRDELVDRLLAARITICRRAELQAANRLYLERMLREPGKHRFARVRCEDLGEPGCGAWQVRPRLGLIGVLMGWWRVKLSSGCPLPRGPWLVVTAPNLRRRCASC